MRNDPLKLMRVIWGALFLSQFLYLYVLTTKLGVGDPMDTGFLRNVFIGEAVVNFALAILLPKFIVSRARKKIGFDHGAPELSVLCRHFMVPFIIRVALFESITLFGFALGVISKDPTEMHPFMAAGLLGYLWSFPTEEKIRSAFQPS